MFDNIKALRLTQDSTNRPIATAMISSEGETMTFRNDGKFNICFRFRIHFNKAE